jgi:rhodanese-related sulfurtransferase
MIKPLVTAFTFAILALPASAQSLIKKDVTEFTVTLNEQTCTIGRAQDADNVVHPSYASTTRGAPQPISLGHGIETLGELEFIDYMITAQKDENIIVIDTRTEAWHQNLRIPCTINVPYTQLNDDKDIAIFTALDYFGIDENDDGSLNFDNAKTVVGYCNGFWCGQTPAMFVKAKYSLINLGYPGDKLKYYRGGMQAWTALGLSVEGRKQ